MTNKSKQKGTSAETEVVKYLQSKGIEAERMALHGNQDQGDIRVRCDGYDCILEVKTGKQTANPSRADLEEWLRQTDIESINAGIPGFLVVRRFRRKLCDCDVWRHNGRIRGHWFLDDFVKEVLLMP